MNIGLQMGLKGTGVLRILNILFSPSPSHTLYAALTWRPTVALNKTALVCLQLRFEAPKDVNLEMLSRRGALGGNTSL